MNSGGIHKHVLDAIYMKEVYLEYRAPIIEIVIAQRIEVIFALIVSPHPTFTTYVIYAS